MCLKSARKVTELERVIVVDDDLELSQAVKELYAVMVGNLRAIRCELELIERNIQLYFKKMRPANTLPRY